MHKIQYMIFKFFQKLLMLLPSKLRFKLADFIAIVGYKVIKKRRLIALANIELAFPEIEEMERVRIAKESYKIMARYFLTTLDFENYIKKDVNIVGLEKVDEALKKGKGLMIAGIHMGNLEASIKLAENYRVVTVAKQQRNPYIDKFITDTRERMNVILLKKSKKTSRELQEYIHKKEIIALFSDHRDKGATVNFFGKETISPTGTINIALKNDIPVVIVYNVMHEDGSSTTYFTDELEILRTDSFKNDVKNNTQNLISKMEQIISNHPNQWMWFHDRWRLSKELKK